MVFAVGNEHGFEPLRAWFAALYEVLLGARQGPRFGGFIALYGVPETIALIDAGAGRAARRGSDRPREGREDRPAAFEASRRRVLAADIPEGVRGFGFGRDATAAARGRRPMGGRGAGWCGGAVATLAARARYRQARGEDPAAAIRQVISEQIEAFKADDFDTAFTFASPGIREMFGTPGRFGAMVREGYPMVWRPGEVRFSDLGERDGRTVQRVLVTDAAGALFVLEYEMVPGEQGWRIDGVRVLQEGAAGA